MVAILSFVGGAGSQEKNSDNHGRYNEVIRTSSVELERHG